MAAPMASGSGQAAGAQIQVFGAIPSAAAGEVPIGLAGVGGGGEPPAVVAVATMPAAASIEQQPIHPRLAEAPATQAAAAMGAGGADAASTSGSLYRSLGSLAQVGAALAVVLGLILIGKALAKKFLPGARVSGGKGVIEILARHPLSKNQSIVLVRIGTQIVALNQGRDSSESVLVISEPTEVARIIGQIEGQSPKSIQAGFNNLLANARMDLEQGESDTEQEPELRGMSPERLDEQLDEMAAAKRQLMELRQHVRSVRDSLPRS
jgi:flagellar biogenesis protein FliO